jgi:hypothetical protein
MAENPSKTQSLSAVAIARLNADGKSLVNALSKSGGERGVEISEHTRREINETAGLLERAVKSDRK